MNQSQENAAYFYAFQIGLITWDKCSELTGGTACNTLPIDYQEKIKAGKKIEVLDVTSIYE